MKEKKPTGRPRKITEYGSQLQEKQKIRLAYGLLEKPFRRYFAAAAKHRGQTGQLLLENLEKRLDNVVYRAGLTLTRAQAKQLISHRHFSLNGKRVSIPSIETRIGDEITVANKRGLPEGRSVTHQSWLKIDLKKGTIQVKDRPDISAFREEFDLQKVIEFYSR